MNGTTLRFATAAACIAALAAPGSALAKKHRALKAKTPSTQIIVQVPHTYDAGGNGIELTAWPAGTRLNLFDPVQLAVNLGNGALGQLGLPPVPLPTPESSNMVGVFMTPAAMPDRKSRSTRSPVAVERRSASN